MMAPAQLAWIQGFQDRRRISGLSTPAFGLDLNFRKAITTAKPIAAVSRVIFFMIVTPLVLPSHLKRALHPG